MGKTPAEEMLLSKMENYEWLAKNGIGHFEHNGDDAVLIDDIRKMLDKKEEVLDTLQYRIENAEIKTGDKDELLELCNLLRYTK